MLLENVKALMSAKMRPLLLYVLQDCGHRSLIDIVAQCRLTSRANFRNARNEISKYALLWSQGGWLDCRFGI